VLRLGLSRAFALLALVPSVTSTPNFMQVPHLRDYAKGPFLLAVILIMGLVVLRTADRRGSSCGRRSPASSSAWASVFELIC
jgi:hypothetical protein